MSKLSAVEGKLARIHEQIEAAKGEIVDIDNEIERIEQELTAQLAKLKPDNEAVTALEGKRSDLTASRSRLQARVAALSGTLPGIESEQMAAELAEAKAEHKDVVQRINEAVKLWEAKAREIADIAAIAETIRTQRRTLADIEGHVRYLCAATGTSMPKLSGAAHVSNEAILSLRSGLRAALDTEVGYYRGMWDERAQELDDAQRGQERVTMREAVTT